MRLAVTEACTNVVRHAYAGRRARPGRDPDPPRGRHAAGDRLRPGARARPERRQHRPRPRPAADRRALALVRDRAGARHRLPAADVVPARRRSWSSRDDGPQAAGEPLTTVSIVAGPLVGPVLRRVVGMLAARADLPLDRLDDAVLVADLIAARAPAHVAGSRVDVALEPGPRSLSLRVGPLRQGGGQALIVDAAVPGVGNVIEQLADELTRVPRGRRGVPARPAGLRGDHRVGRRAWLGRTPRADGDRVRDRRPQGRRRHARDRGQRARSTCSRRPSSSSACRR